MKWAGGAGKGASIVSTALIVLFLGASFITYYIYSEYQQSIAVSGITVGKLAQDVNQLRDVLGRIENVIPEDALNQILNASQFSFQAKYVETTDYTAEGNTTKAIVFADVGNSPLSGMEVYLNGNKIVPYYRPLLVLPGEKGIVVLTPEQSASWTASHGMIGISIMGKLSLNVSTGLIPPS